VRTEKKIPYNKLTFGSFKNNVILTFSHELLIIFFDKKLQTASPIVSYSCVIDFLQ
jgi:hypothetical protein